MSVDPHTHPALEDRITAEIAGVHTELVAMRVEIRRGFTDVAQVLGQILARLPESGGDDGAT